MLSRREIWTGFLLYPSHTLPTAAAPIAVAAGLAAHDGVFAPVPLVVAFVGDPARVPVALGYSVLLGLGLALG